MPFPNSVLVAAVLTLAGTGVAAQGGAVAAGGATQHLATGFGLPADSRRGLWLGAGLGTGAGSLHCGICNHESEQGTTGYLRAGTTVNRKLLLGVEAGAWQRSGEEGKRRILAFTGGAWWYPSERRAWFVRFGAGLSRWRAWQDNQAVTSQAIALVAGVGFEARVSPVLSVVPYLNMLGSSKGSLWLEQKDEVSSERRRLPSGGHALLLQIGVGITRH